MRGREDDLLDWDNAYLLDADTALDKSTLPLVVGDVV